MVLITTVQEGLDALKKDVDKLANKIRRKEISTIKDIKELENDHEKMVDNSNDIKNDIKGYINTHKDMIKKIADDERYNIPPGTVSALESNVAMEKGIHIGEVVLEPIRVKYRDLPDGEDKDKIAEDITNIENVALFIKNHTKFLNDHAEIHEKLLGLKNNILKRKKELTDDVLAGRITIKPEESESEPESKPESKPEVIEEKLPETSGSKKVFGIIQWVFIILLIIIAVISTIYFIGVLVAFIYALAEMRKRFRHTGKIFLWNAIKNSLKSWWFVAAYVTTYGAFG